MMHNSDFETKKPLLIYSQDNVKDESIWWAKMAVPELAT